MRKLLSKVPPVVIVVLGCIVSSSAVFAGWFATLVNLPMAFGVASSVGLMAIGFVFIDVGVEAKRVRELQFHHILAQLDPDGPEARGLRVTRQLK